MNNNETIEQCVLRMLVEKGLFEHMAVEVMESVKTAPENQPMSERWQDSVDDYPAVITNTAWISAKIYAREYIDEHLPMAWFRPMFE